MTHKGFDQSNAWQARLHHAVPGGAHTYARGADQYPLGMAPVLTHGLGARVWDVDENAYVEYGMGLRAITLGHAYAPVVAAVRETLEWGVSFSRPTVFEAEAAEDFLRTVPTAEMVKFAKNGSDVTTAALRLARAVTGRPKVAACLQPFFSTDDWFIGTTEMNAGIPKTAIDDVIRFDYNDLDSLTKLFEEQPGQIACVIMEAASAAAEPEPGFLDSVRTLCTQHGALLVFDEIITGFRWSRAGAQAVYGVTPDLSCWGKAMGNGFAIAALAGRREYMERGGLRTEDPRTFLLSTTNGPEAVGLAAFRAVVQAYRDDAPIRAMEAAGRDLAAGVAEVTTELGVSEHIRTIGRPSCLTFTSLDPDGIPSQAYRALLLQELLRRGVLGQSFVISAAHTPVDIEVTVDAVRGAAEVYRRALEAGTTDGFLLGPPVAPALRSLAAPRRIS
ncbi:glutamate-1-semialdehyde 2,1-aminomutase [Mycobacteroides franklinii]|uniref:Glutamate-1-semialdehyde 2,1-aminomutase n=1 Tax=Mycobacteroides franklinii TaxID=948102 RepID=A0A4R5P8U9_9MYCO|nr:glutamate-1-semialdehyde 2,1-aminomutase [Mycobacteroides franklinii]ORA59949.1 glutamate-1-semialdehyde 2,1-aminomutase [Mycobacteroides franklinii]TDH20315.1 glutamate-1-semialdehyde 2,1-aminomutase [Mycobacteroides franklinii]